MFLIGHLRLSFNLHFRKKTNVFVVALWIPCEAFIGFTLSSAVQPFVLPQGICCVYQAVYMRLGYTHLFQQ